MTLRALEPTDLDLLYTIENDPEQWDVCTTGVPYSRYDLENYILSQQHDIYADRQLRLVIVAGEEDESKNNGESGNKTRSYACEAKKSDVKRSCEGRAVGLIDLFNYSPAHHRAELGIAILREERGKGYATSALRLMNEYARKTLHLHQLYCIVPEDNRPSLEALHSAGYAGDTILSDWLATPDGYKNCIALFKLL